MPPSSDLVPAAELLDPRTGEMIPAADADRVADLLAYLRTLKDDVLQGIKACEAAIYDEAMRQGSKTLHLGPRTAKITGGPVPTYDVEVLRELLDAGLPEERWSDLVTTTVEEKVNARVAKQLASNPDYAAIIERARSLVDKPWRVSV